MADDSKPDYRDTKQIPKIDEVKILFADLKNEMRVGFHEIQVNHDANHKVVMHEIGIVKDRVKVVEDWKEDSTQKLTNHSKRIEQPSSHDLEVKAELAKEIEARKLLAEKLEKVELETLNQTKMLVSLTKTASKFFSNPTVRMIAVIIGTTVANWLTNHVK